MNMQYLDVPVEPVVLSCKPQSCLTLLVVKPPVKKSFSFNHARSYRHVWPFPKYSVGMNFIWYALLFITIVIVVYVWVLTPYGMSALINMFCIVLWLINCKPFGRWYRVSSWCFINSIVVITGQCILIIYNETIYTQKWENV